MRAAFGTYSTSQIEGNASRERGKRVSGENNSLPEKFSFAVAVTKSYQKMGERRVFVSFTSQRLRYRQGGLLAHQRAPSGGGLTKRVGSRDQSSESTLSAKSPSLNRSRRSSASAGPIARSCSRRAT